MEALFAEHGFELGRNLSITANPSQEFIQARMDELYGPEITNIHVRGPESRPQTTKIGQVEQLKTSGNEFYKSKDYQKAITAFTSALDASTGSTPLELRRTVLSNRCQCYLNLDDVATALHDVTLALSEQFTNPNSPVPLTLKLHYRRATIFKHMAKYEEAKEDYDKFELMKHVMNLAVHDDEKKLGSEIREGLEDSQRKAKDDLIRAADSLGLTMCTKHRTSPSASHPLSVELTTPLCIPIIISAPFFLHILLTDPLALLIPHAVPLTAVLHAVVRSHIISIGSRREPGMPRRVRDVCARSAKEHADVEVLVVTHRGRVLRVPQECTLGEIVRAARWPAPGGSAGQVEDLRLAKRRRGFEVDGLELREAWVLEIQVVPKKKLNEYLDSLELAMIHHR